MMLEWKTNHPSKPDKQPPLTSEAGSDDPSGDRFLNKFAVLTVEEPLETTQAQPAPTESKKIVNVNVVGEERDDTADSYLSQLFFKTLCLLQDLNNMQKFISITWSEYRNRKTDLMNAAVVADSALNLTRDLVQELEADWRTSLAKRKGNV